MTPAGRRRCELRIGATGSGREESGVEPPALHGIAAPCGSALRHNTVWRFGLRWLDTAFGLATADSALAWGGVSVIAPLPSKWRERPAPGRRGEPPRPPLQLGLARRKLPTGGADATGHRPALAAKGRVPGRTPSPILAEWISGMGVRRPVRSQARQAGHNPRLDSRLRRSRVGLRSDGGRRRKHLGQRD